MTESTSKAARQGAADSRAHTLARGRGSSIELWDGRTLLDAASGTFNVPLGYDHSRVVGAIRRQLLASATFLKAGIRSGVVVVGLAELDGPISRDGHV
ncbi:hypothetical protein ABT263_28070, partial [Kitasatospora sp. NPDC001603]